MTIIVHLIIAQQPSHTTTTSNEYSAFMGDLSTCTGIATFTMMFLSRVIFYKYGWGVAATITPTMLLATRVAFFGLILYSEPLTPLLGKFGVTPLLAATYIGALQNIFSESAKYSLFDPCKEMAYVPLDEDTKVYCLCILSEVFKASVYSIFTFIFPF